MTNEEKKERRRRYNEKYQEKNKDKRRVYDKLYYSQNKEKKKKSVKEYIRKKRNTDLLFKMTCNISRNIRLNLKKRGYTKNTKTTKILGCTFGELRNHLESKFDYWMNWDNHGLYNGELNYGWDYDHIIPLSSAKNEEELVKLFHYTNLQPLCSKINRDVKKNNVEYGTTKS